MLKLLLAIGTGYLVGNEKARNKFNGYISDTFKSGINLLNNKVVDYVNVKKPDEISNADSNATSTGNL